MYGADADALDALASRMLAAAEQLEATRLSVRSLLYSVPWHGEDAEGFRGDWDGPHAARLNAAVVMIRAGADAVKRNAAEQRRASDVSDGVGGRGGARETWSGALGGAGVVAGAVLAGMSTGDAGPEPGPWRDERHWYEPWTWGYEKPPSVDPELRVSPEPLFDGPPKADDVVQGDLGDCYLAAAAASVASADPEIIRNMVTDNQDGTFTVTFHNSDGGIDRVTVDGKLYTTSDGATAYAHPNDDQWFPIMEKAYAKWKGDYTSVGNGGNATDALAAITGTHTDSGNLGGFMGMSNDDAWRQIQQSVDSHHPITASTDGSIAASDDPNSLIGDHVYSVIGYKTAADGSHWVTVRNPWGSHPGDDGVGDISIDDFRQGFSNLQWTR